MSDLTFQPQPLQWDVWRVLFAALLMSLVGVSFASSTRSRKQPPLINGQYWYELSDTRAKIEFFASARSLLYKGREIGKVFRMICNFGESIMLDPQYIDEVKSHPGLSFGKWLEKSFMAHIPGFESYSAWVMETRVLSHVALSGITSALDRLVQPLTEETTVALDDVLGDSTEWRETFLHPLVPEIVARLSSRVFVGQDLCRNPDWLRITVNYAVDSVLAARVIARWPRILQPLAHWFIPECQKVRGHVQAARKLMGPIIHQRRKERMNKKVPREARDAIDWFYEVVKDKPFDPVTFQLTLSTVAIHSTSDLLMQALLDIGSHPELIDELRQEVITVFSTGGFKRSSINNLKLMDSVLKESQRLKPLALVAIQRVATEDIELSNGLLIRKGETIGIPGYGMWDSKVYSGAEKFDGHRFLRIRENSEEDHGSQLVTTSPDHLGFGHGKHACPGRFFAAMEAKIALADFLLKYDFKLSPGTKPRVFDAGFALIPDPTAKVAIKRRQEEISLGQI